MRVGVAEAEVDDVMSVVDVEEELVVVVVGAEGIEGGLRVSLVTLFKTMGQTTTKTSDKTIPDPIAAASQGRRLNQSQVLAAFPFS